MSLEDPGVSWNYIMTGYNIKMDFDVNVLGYIGFCVTGSRQGNKISCYFNYIKTSFSKTRVLLVI
jgi:hypothetical protein